MSDSFDTQDVSDEAFLRARDSVESRFFVFYVRPSW